MCSSRDDVRGLCWRGKVIDRISYGLPRAPLRPKELKWSSVIRSKPNRRWGSHRIDLNVWRLFGLEDEPWAFVTWLQTRQRERGVFWSRIVLRHHWRAPITEHRDIAFGDTAVGLSVQRLFYSNLGILASSIDLASHEVFCCREIAIRLPPALHEWNATTCV